jgi:malate dehydrogenase (oxaloacetate-decarboxylating)(NADP+)
MRLGIDQRLMSRIINRAKKSPKRVVFAEADNAKILKAAQIVQDEGIGYPILLGNKEKIERLIAEHQLELDNCEVIDVHDSQLAERVERYATNLFERRKRKGVTMYEARKLMRDRNYFGAMMLHHDECDALISGLTKDYPKTLTPALQVIGTECGIDKVAGMYIISNKNNTYFFSDTTVNRDPSAEELVDIIGLTARGVKFFDHTPRMAVLSYSNFGSSRGNVPDKAAKATALAKAKYPELLIEGDMQANIALNPQLQRENYPFSDLSDAGANTLIFPNLASGNIAYKLLMEIGGAEAIGPVLMGMCKPVHILQLGSSIREIVNMVAIAVVDAQQMQEKEL